MMLEAVKGFEHSYLHGYLQLFAQLFTKGSSTVICKHITKR